jgi:hypothetical protein
MEAANAPRVKRVQISDIVHEMESDRSLPLPSFAMSTSDFHPTAEPAQRLKPAPSGKRVVKRANPLKPLCSDRCC